MSKAVKNLFLVMVCFGLGFLYGRYHTITSNTYTLTSPISLETAQGQLAVPKGTELHKHSAAHSRTTYFFFFNLPDTQNSEVVEKTEFDDWGGIKVLNSK